MSVIPVFPLGMVLLPAMPFALRVFEQRYLKMMGDVLELDEPEFGIVLIERGSEVGGGDQRMGVGTLARIDQLEAPEDFLVLTGVGTERFVVSSWLDDDPYPRAEVEFLEPLVETPELADRLDGLELQVRQTLQLAHEYGMGGWPVDIALAEEPIDTLWQLAGIAPLTSLDHYLLLQSESTAELTSRLDEMVRETEQGLQPPEQN